MAAEGPKTVLVTGAGGKTGKLTLQKLLAQSQLFQTRAFVHTQQSADRVASETEIPRDRVYAGDICAQDTGDLRRAMEGAHALVVATSAAPKLKASSLFGVVLKKVTFQGGAMPAFWYPQMPEQVDWVGQRNQIDAAKAAGVKHVVLISTMAGTKPDHFLNKMGGGHIVIWKRKAEKYLLQSGLDYTIIHPGGLTDAAGGEKQLVVGVDDVLMDSAEKKIPRADVAELCVQALQHPEYRNRSFDVVARAEAGSTDYRALLRDMTKDCDYSLGVTEPAAAS